MLEYGNKNGVRIIDAQNLYFHLYTEDTVTDYLLDGIHPTALGHEAIAGFLQE
jgi:lysophospholipase L1-like esterase